jgi:hypothetical protein
MKSILILSINLLFKCLLNLGIKILLFFIIINLVNVRVCNLPEHRVKAGCTAVVALVDDNHVTVGTKIVAAI